MTTVVRSKDFQGYKGVCFEKVYSIAIAKGEFQGLKFEFERVDGACVLSVKANKINSRHVNLYEQVFHVKHFNPKAKLQSRRRFRVLLKKLIKASN